MVESTKRYLKQVHLNADVFAGCVIHCLSTEKEEVMGLLLGRVDEETCISYITSYLILRRSDKQADRVEISDDQLATATMYAEHLSKQSKEPIRVVGWYHSHPHITVWPSHVDVRTQAMYQMIDQFFVGLIFSTFPNEAKNIESLSSKPNEIQLTCFQSQGDVLNCERREIPCFVKQESKKSYNLKLLTELPKILKEEEELVAADLKTETVKRDPLINLHNKAHKDNNMLHITSKVSRPLYETVIIQNECNKCRLTYLKNEVEYLTKELQYLNKT